MMPMSIDLLRLLVNDISDIREGSAGGSKEKGKLVGRGYRFLM
jgi:hypothetical protein